MTRGRLLDALYSAAVLACIGGAAHGCTNTAAVFEDSADAGVEKDPWGRARLVDGEPHCAGKRHDAGIMPDVGPLARPDVSGMPDGDAGAGPISEEALKRTLRDTRIDCAHDGSTWSKSIVENDMIVLLDGAVTLQGATADTRQWAASPPSATLVWDIDTCGCHHQQSGCDFSSVGLLIRGATRDAAGNLVLAPGTTLDDFNLVNVDHHGAFQEDLAQPDDSHFADYPRLVQPVAAAKRAVMALVHASASTNAANGN